MPRIIPEKIIVSPGSGDGGPTGKAVQTTFVFKPGGTAEYNTYVSWLALLTDFNLVDGPKIIQIDDSIVSPALIPSSTNNLSGSVLMGHADQKGNYPVIQLEDGVIFGNVDEIRNLEIIGNSVAPVFDISIQKQITLKNVIMSVNSGKSHIFNSDSSFDLVLDNTSLIGTEPIINVDNDTTTIWLENKSSIASGLITSGILSDVNFYFVDSNVSLLSQAGILGSSIQLLLSEADKIFYDNSSSGLTAENVQDAIDELISVAGVIGPGISIDKGIVTWNGTTGNTLQDSGIRYYGKSATDPSSPTPEDGDLYYNTVLKMQMEYDASRSKWLSTETQIIYFGKSKDTQPGQYFKGLDGKVFSNTIGYYTEYNGTIISISFTRANTESITLEITESGTQISTLGPTTAIADKSIVVNNNFSANGVLSVRNLSSGGIATDILGQVRIKWRI